MTLTDELHRLAQNLRATTSWTNVAQLADAFDNRAGMVDRLEAELGAARLDATTAQDEFARVRTDYEAQLEAVHDLTETLAEERVQHAAQMDRLRCELAATLTARCGTCGGSGHVESPWGGPEDSQCPDCAVVEFGGAA